MLDVILLIDFTHHFFESASWLHGCRSALVPIFDLKVVEHALGRLQILVTWLLVIRQVLGNGRVTVVVLVVVLVVVSPLVVITTLL